MSGGHYDYANSKLNCILDQIQSDLDEDFKSGYKEYKSDYLAGSTEEEKAKFIKFVKSLLKSGKKLSKNLRKLEWFLSGDTGITSVIGEASVPGQSSSCCSSVGCRRA